MGVEAQGTRRVPWAPWEMLHRIYSRFEFLLWNPCPPRDDLRARLRRPTGVPVLIAK